MKMPLLTKTQKRVAWGVGIAVVILTLLYQFIKFAAIAGGANFSLWAWTGSSNSYAPDRTVQTDAPVQVIYRIDENRFLTLENYITCEKGGQVYYNDTGRNIRTALDNWNREGSGLSEMASYQGELINAATNGTLVLVSAPDYCSSNTGCGIYPHMSLDYGKTFTPLGSYGSTFNPRDLSKNYKIVVTNEGMFSLDMTFDSNKVIKTFYLNGEIVTPGMLRERERIKLLREELRKRKMLFPEDEKGDTPDTYPSMTTYEQGKSDEELRLAYRVRQEIYNRTDADVPVPKTQFPEVKSSSIDAHYHCDNTLTAKTITYTDSEGHKEVVNYDAKQ